MNTNSTRCWENKKSKRHDKREYFVNTESGVSQWGRQDPKLPLPAGWEYCISKSKKPFYYNLHYKLAQWKKPTEADRLPVPEGFEEKRSKKCKNVYYVNLETGKTQWEYPETRGNEDSHFELIEDEDPIGKVYRLKKLSGSDSESGSDVSYSHPYLDTRTEHVLKTRGSKNVGLETSSDEDEEWYDDETRFGAGKKIIRKGNKNKANQRRTPTRNHKKEMQKIKRLKNKFAKKEDEVVEQDLIRHDSEDSLTDQSVDQDEIDRLYQIYDERRNFQEDLKEDEDLYKSMEKDLDDERRNFQEDLQEDEDLYKSMEKDLNDERRNFQEDLQEDEDILSRLRGSRDVGFGGFGDKNLARDRTYQDDLNHEYFQDRLTQTRGSKDLKRETRFGADKKFLDQEIKGKAIRKRTSRNHKKEMHLRDKIKKLSRLISLMNEERDKDTEEYEELRNMIQETRGEISRLKKQSDTNEESEDDFFDVDEDPKYRLLAKQLIKEDRSTPIVDQYREIQPIVKDEAGIGLPYPRQDHRSLSRERLEKHREIQPVVKAEASIGLPYPRQDHRSLSRERLEKHRNQENRRHSHRDEQYTGQFFDKISKPLSPDDEIIADFP
jgi:hypothetical protein